MRKLLKWLFLCLLWFTVNLLWVFAIVGIFAEQWWPISLGSQQHLYVSLSIVGLFFFEMFFTWFIIFSLRRRQIRKIKKQIIKNNKEKLKNEGMQKRRQEQQERSSEPKKQKKQKKSKQPEPVNNTIKGGTKNM